LRSLKVLCRGFRRHTWRFEMCCPIFTKFCHNKSWSGSLSGWNTGLNLCSYIDVLLSSLFRCVQEFGNPGRGSQLEAAGGTGQGDQLCRVPHQAALVIKAPIAVAEFIDPWLGDTVKSGMGLSYRHARLHAWRACTTTLCRSWLSSPVRDLWIRLQYYTAQCTVHCTHTLLLWNKLFRFEPVFIIIWKLYLWMCN